MNVTDAIKLRIDKYCKNLNFAIAILKDDYRFDKDIVALIKTEYQSSKEKLPLSIPSFSNYIHASEKKLYEKVDYRVYKKYCDILNSVIKKRYKKHWDEEKEEYISLTVPSDSQKENDVSKLTGFYGVWKGYSWNNSQSKIVSLPRTPSLLID